MSTLLARTARIHHLSFALPRRAAAAATMSSSATHRLSASPPSESMVKKPRVEVPSSPPSAAFDARTGRDASPSTANASATKWASPGAATRRSASPSQRATPSLIATTSARPCSPTSTLIPALSSNTVAATGDEPEPRWPLGRSNKAKRQDEALERKKRALERKRREVLRPKQLAKFGEDPIFFDIVEMVGQAKVDALIAEGKEFDKRFPKDDKIELELEILRLSAHGDGLALAPSGDWVIRVPKTLPGELVRARIWQDERLYSTGDLLEIVKKAPNRQQVKCKYFSHCNGCQYQTLKYDEQLDIKRDVVSRAFANYSTLDASLLPAVSPTLASPEQFAYRTKLTPHFELPKAVRAFRKSAAFTSGAKFYVQPKEDPLAIGFDNARGNGVVDIEECPLATQTINDKLGPVRQQVRDSIGSYKNGATLLFRDSLVAFDGKESEAILDSHQVVKEQVGSIKFESPAGAFFQNNRSILPSLVAYVKEAILAAQLPTPAYLVDTYCGSGFFALCLADLFKEVRGVELSKESIVCAKKNAKLNGIENVDFLAASAEQIFQQIKYPAEATTVIIDPPRRGCDEVFLNQLLKLSPELIVYVSCNTFTVARDVGIIVKRTPEYEVVSIRAADLFPQSWHPEVVTVLRKRRGAAAKVVLEEEVLKAPAAVPASLSAA